MVVNFVTPTQLSILDITTIGSSEKRNDDSKIGFFGSGFAYFLALMLRNNVDVHIEILGGNTLYHDSIGNEKECEYTEEFTFSTKKISCDSTGKEKEIINVHYFKTHIGNDSDYLEGKYDEKYEVSTGFSKELGFNWLLWMGLREVVSNTFDEGGYFTEDNVDRNLKCGTIITLEFEEDSTFHEVWENKDKYINSRVALYSVNSQYYGQFDLLPNEDGYLKIYKQNILVHSDEEVVSKFAYNIHFGELDERRILLDLYSVKSKITQIIKSSTNSDFLRYLITQDFDVEDWLNYNDNYTSEATDLIFNLVHEINPQNTLKWIKDSVTKRSDCKLAGKVINSLEDHVWSAKSKVTIDSTPIIQEEKEITFQDQINKLYKFDIGDVCIKTAQLTGKKVVADKYEKCLILSDDFSLEDDFNDFVTEYFNLTSNENIIKSLSNYIVKLIKK